MTSINNSIPSEFSNPAGFPTEVNHGFEFDSNSADRFLKIDDLENSTNNFPNNYHANLNKSLQILEHANNVNNFPRDYTKCLDDLSLEYGGKVNDLSKMDMRGYCVAKVADFAT